MSDIGKKAKNSEFIALERHKIDSYNFMDLDKVLSDIYCSSRPVFADYITRMELVQNFNDMAEDIYGNSEESIPVLEAYGSFVTDTFSRQSDLDVSINFLNGTTELTREMKIEVLKRFARKLHFLKGKGIVRNVEPILTARVPIIKFCDQRTGLECDLSVENKDAILNSQIIRIVSQIDGRFHILCMLVKHWAKTHEVNSAVHRTLNSLSITLLVALHLQTQDPPILPPFSMLFGEGIDPPKVEERIQNFLNQGQPNHESVAKLFATFFIKLQSVEYLWKEGLCVSVLNGLWISKKWEYTGDVESISVENFTNVTQNVARQVNEEGARKIYSSINQTVEDIIEFLDGKVTGTQLIHSLFGQQAETELRRWLSRQNDVMEPPPHVQLLNAGTDLGHRLSRQLGLLETPPLPPYIGNIAGTPPMFSGRQSVLEPRPPPPLLPPLLPPPPPPYGPQNVPHPYFGRPFHQ
ncbi:protein HESO1 [Capsella rubella]|nr:protein HESO1 [Capsella rubella]